MINLESKAGPGFPQAGGHLCPEATAHAVLTPHRWKSETLKSKAVSLVPPSLVQLCL